METLISNPPPASTASTEEPPYENNGSVTPLGRLGTADAVNSSSSAFFFDRLMDAQKVT